MPAHVENPKPRHKVTPQNNVFPEPQAEAWGIHPDSLYLPISERVRAGVSEMEPERFNASNIITQTVFERIKEGKLPVKVNVEVYNGSPNEPIEKFTIQAFIGNQNKYGLVYGGVVKPEKSEQESPISKAVRGKIKKALKGTQRTIRSAIPEAGKKKVTIRINQDHIVAYVPSDKAKQESGGDL